MKAVATQSSPTTFLSSSSLYNTYNYNNTNNNYQQSPLPELEEEDHQQEYEQEQEQEREKLRRELAHEESMFNRGYNRFMCNINKHRTEANEGTSIYGIRLLKRCIAPFSIAIEDFVHKAFNGSVGKKNTAAQYLKGIDSKVVAFITLRTLIDCVSDTNTKLYQTYALRIGSKLQLEDNLNNLKKLDSDAYDAMMRHIESQKSNHYIYRKTCMRYMLTKSLLVDFEPWPKDVAFHVGSKLIDLLISSTNLFRRIEIPYKSKSQAVARKVYTVVPTSECMEFIHSTVDKESVLSPDFYPTIIPPKSWGKDIVGGGYYHPKLPQLTMVKTYNSKYLELLQTSLDKGELTEVVMAINSLQNTGWAINKNVYEVADYLWWERRGGMADLPYHDDEPLPPCPVCGADVTAIVNAYQKHECLTELKLTHPEAFQAWRKAAAVVRLRSAVNFGRRLGVSRILVIAKAMLNEPVFYFPYQLDFRGRIYAVPPYLNPQGTQLAKGLLQFAEGKPLGDMQAVRWLAIHGANTFGNDKVSLDERYQWVIEHQNDILASAENPYENRWWQDADEPFCFLAFCYEWQGYCTEGLDYISHIPVAMDGSCNGLQIFSLMLKDSVGGHAVNLTPEDTPQDIYAIVADKVRKLLEQDVLKKDTSEEEDNVVQGKIAQALLDIGINRKTTKRQVMVLPYGGTSQSCKDYTKEWLVEKIYEEGCPWSQEISVNKAASYLTKHIWNSIHDTVVAARDAMDFLRKVANQIVKQDIPIHWTSPCGFPVFQNYKANKTRRLKTILGETITYFSLDYTTDTMDKTRQRNGISPNFVHSLDASALMKTVCRTSLQDNIHNFAMIHDSYGTHAADTAKLACTLRCVFVEMFSTTNMLERFLSEVKESIPVEQHQYLPPLPQMGTLDIHQVLNSKFFFA